MNYYELGLFNQMVASRRDADSADSPDVTYFVPVQPGQPRSYGNTGTCCGGTGMENHTKYQDSIYFRSVDETTLYVNLYIASTLSWPEKGFTVTQETRYPLEDTSVLTMEGNGQLDVRLRVPEWVRKGYTVTINGEPQTLEAAPGTYVSLNRRWSSGDRIEISMPFSFRVEEAIDDPSVQSIYYGPTLLAAQAEPLGDNLESGLYPVSLYRHLKLDGDLAPAMAPGDEPLHFETNGLTLAPFFISDPVPPGWEPPDPDPDAPFQGRGRRSPPTQPYHLYLRRQEPVVVFGSEDSGVENPVGSDGSTFLDAVWARAPFPSHERFVSTVETLTAEWEGAGLLTEFQSRSIVEAASRAEAAMTS
jgi:hypothetical protein